MPSNMTLEKAIALFLDRYPKEPTKHAYQVALYPLADQIGGSVPLARILPEHVGDAVTQTLIEKEYSKATRFTRSKSIRAFFNWCVKMGWIKESPARIILLSAPPRRISRDKAMTDDELDAILDVLKHKARPKDYALVLFLADTGCRRGGAAKLRLHDIDFEALTATVTEKGDIERTVAFSAKCAAAIRHWLAYREAHHSITGEYIFSADGEPPGVEYLSLIIRRTCHSAGVRTQSTHSLRHRKGHQLADLRIAASVGATALGITPKVMHDHYYPGDWDSAEKALRELMGDAPAAAQSEPPAPAEPEKKSAKILLFPGVKRA